MYDLNANCAGMTVALEQVSHYMNSNKSIQYALIVGADYLSLISDTEDPLSYSCFGDGVAAIIVERTTEEVGFIDSAYHVNTIYAEKMMYPAEGLAKGIRDTNDLKRMLETFLLMAVLYLMQPMKCSIHCLIAIIYDLVK